MSGVTRRVILRDQLEDGQGTSDNEQPYADHQRQVHRDRYDNQAIEEIKGSIQP